MTPHGTILLVDDEEKIVKTLGRALRTEGHDVAEARSADEARELLGRRSFDLLIVDNLMPGTTGLELIRRLAADGDADRPQIVMMTAHASIEGAVEAMKLGALDYLQKPFEVDELLVVVRRALEDERLRTENRYLLSERDEEFSHYGIVGRSKVMQEIIRTAEVVAESRSTVLITGETGTGKELVARAIHDRSAQRTRPLVKVNCAAIPETLLESELFGHVRGAFTGAVTSRRGRFALADGGTIFLDEIATLIPGLQSKLLRVLQEREFEPLGSDRTAARRRPRDRGHQPRPAPDGGGRQVPGGPVLPARRHSDRHPALARPHGGYPGARRAFRQGTLAAAWGAGRSRSATRP